MENELLKKRIGEHVAVAQAVLSDRKLLSSVEKIADKLIFAYRNGGKLIVMGNGGSAADAQHMAAEMLGKYLKERKAVPAIALSANSSAMTAIANDYGYDRAFSRQLEAWAGKNDVVIGISASGNSPNVVSAVKYAKSMGIFTACFVGGKKCRLEEVCDVAAKVPSESTPRIQEMHGLIMHCICEIVEETLSP